MDLQENVMGKFAWVPEAPEFGGVYANESDTSNGGKIRQPGLQPSTRNVNAAKQFEAEADCQAWCDANPVPKFVPREHGWF